MVKDYVVFDLETTGLSPDKDTIIEIGRPEGHSGESGRPFFGVYQSASEVDAADFRIDRNYG